MKPETFDLLRKTIKDHSGIALEKEKEYLIRSRFEALFNRNEFDTLDDFVRWTREHQENWDQFVSEQLATHETYFYRDPDMYEDLRSTILPRIVPKGQPKIWSIGCSSGQEPVSLAFELAAASGDRPFPRPPILATDFSHRIIERARSGLYSQYEIQRGLPVRMLITGFEQLQTDWLVKKRYRDMIEYRIDNLFKPDIPESGFDLILIRNVLIYFTMDDRRRIIEFLYNKLASGGYLILGGAETLFGITDRFKKVESVKTIINQKP